MKKGSVLFFCILLAVSLSANGFKADSTKEQLKVMIIFNDTDTGGLDFVKSLNKNYGKLNSYNPILMAVAYGNLFEITKAVASSGTLTAGMPITEKSVLTSDQKSWIRSLPYTIVTNSENNALWAGPSNRIDQDSYYEVSDLLEQIKKVPSDPILKGFESMEEKDIKRINHDNFKMTISLNNPKTHNLSGIKMNKEIKNGKVFFDIEDYSIHGFISKEYGISVPFIRTDVKNFLFSAELEYEGEDYKMGRDSIFHYLNLGVRLNREVREVYILNLNEYKFQTVEEINYSDSGYGLIGQTAEGIAQTLEYIVDKPVLIDKDQDIEKRYNLFISGEEAELLRQKKYIEGKFILTDAKMELQIPIVNEIK